MRPYVNSKGYCQVMLYDGSGRTEQPHVHRLVAVAFLGQRPGMEVDHINRDRRDNRLANLGWVTSSENNYNRDLGRVAA